MRRKLLPDPEVLKMDKLPMLTDMLEHAKRNIEFYHEKLNSKTLVLTELELKFFTDQFTKMHNRKARLERLIENHHNSIDTSNKHDTEASYLDMIPELCLINLMSYLTTAETRNLFLSLSTESQATTEYLFINKIRSVFAYRNTWDKVEDCEGDFCKKLSCIRCFLNIKYECQSCKQPTQIPMMNCDSTIITSYGNKCACNELRRCECGNTYSSDMRHEVVRYLDRQCDCHTGYVGCEKCVRECLWCANVGCVKDEHYKINPNPYSDGPVPDWPDCKDCNLPHCCAALMKTDGEGVDAEWEYFACPRWELIG